MIRVDPIFTMEPKGAQARRCGNRWSHLFADTPEELPELHRIAAAAGMRRAWFQNSPGKLPHYDLVPSRRAAALKAGAVEGTQQDLVTAIRRFRATASETPDAD